MSSMYHDVWSPLIPALPAGAMISKVGRAKAGDFEMVGDKIVKASPRSSGQVIVVPAKGYTFKFVIETNSYKPVTMGPHLTTVTFDVSDPEHAKFVGGLFEHPAFVSQDSSPAPTVSDALRGSALK